MLQWALGDAASACAALAAAPPPALPADSAALTDALAALDLLRHLESKDSRLLRGEDPRLTAHQVCSAHDARSEPT